MTKKISDQTQRKLGIIISYFSIAASIVITLFFTPFELNHLGGDPTTATTQYGLRSFVSSIATWLTLLSSAMASSYVRFATKAYQDRQDEGVSKINGIFFFFFTIFAIVALLVGGLIFLFLKINVIPLDKYDEGQKQLIYYLFLISFFSAPISILGTVFSNFCLYKQKFVFLRGISLVVTIITPVVSYPFLKMGCDVVTVSIISTIITILGTLANVDYALSVLKMNFVKDRGEEYIALKRNILLFSSIVLFNVIVDQIENYIDKTILGIFVGADPVALYNLGMTFSSLLVSASIAISGSFSPRINQLVVSGKREEVNRLFLKVSRIQMFVVFLIVGGFWACGKDFVVAWIGKEKSDVYWISCILLTISTVPLSENLEIEIQRAENKHKFRGIVYFIAAIINVIISIICVLFMDSKYAVFGCLIGTSISTIGAKWIAMNIYNRKSLELDTKKFWLMFFEFSVVTAASVLFTAAISPFLPQQFSWKWTLSIIEGLIFLSFWVPSIFLVNFRFLKFLFENKRRQS